MSKFVSHAVTSGAGAPHDGLRCHQFDTKDEVMAAAKAAIAFQLDMVNANTTCCAGKADCPSQPTSRSVVISNTVFAPDGSLYFACSLTYGNVSDELLAAGVASFAANHESVAKFVKS